MTGQAGSAKCEFCASDGAECLIELPPDTSPMRRRTSSRDSFFSTLLMEFSPRCNDQVRIIRGPCWRNAWFECVTAEASACQLIRGKLRQPPLCIGPG